MSPANAMVIPVVLTAPLDIVKVGLVLGIIFCVRSYRSRHGRNSAKG